MTKPFIWSELPEPNADHLAHDCAYSTALEALIWGGFTDFPLGIYTVAEREALEREDDRPDEEGATEGDIDLAVQRRYGKHLHTPTEATFRAAWQPGRFLSVGGTLPDGKRHRIGVLIQTDTTGLKYDPLRAMKSAPAATTLTDISRFNAGRPVSDLRFTLQNEYATSGGGSTIMGFQGSVANPPKVGLVTFDKGDPAWRYSDAQEITLSTGGVRDGYAFVSSKGTPGYVVNLTSGGVTEAYFLRASDVTFAPSTPVATKLGPGLYEV